VGGDTEFVGEKRFRVLNGWAADIYFHGIGMRYENLTE